MFALSLPRNHSHYQRSPHIYSCDSNHRTLSHTQTHTWNARFVVKRVRSEWTRKKRTRTSTSNATNRTQNTFGYQIYLETNRTALSQHVRRAFRVQRNRTLYRIEPCRAHIWLLSPYCQPVMCTYAYATLHSTTEHVGCFYVSLCRTLSNLSPTATTATTTTTNTATRPSFWLHFAVDLFGSRKRTNGGNRIRFIRWFFLFSTLFVCWSPHLRTFARNLSRSIWIINGRSFVSIQVDISFLCMRFWRSGNHQDVLSQNYCQIVDELDGWTFNGWFHCGVWVNGEVGIWIFLRIDFRFHLLL